MLFGEWLKYESKRPVTINRDIDKWFDRAEGLKDAVKKLKDTLDKQKPEEKHDKSKQSVKSKDHSNKHPDDDKTNKRDEPTENDDDDQEEQTKKVKLPQRVLDGLKGKPVMKSDKNTRQL